MTQNMCTNKAWRINSHDSYLVIQPRTCHLCQLDDYFPSLALEAQNDLASRENWFLEQVKENVPSSPSGKRLSLILSTGKLYLTRPEVHCEEMGQSQKAWIFWLTVGEISSPTIQINSSNSPITAILNGDILRKKVGKVMSIYSQFSR